MNWREILKRLQGNRTQTQFAKILSISQPQYSRLLNGKRQLTLELKRKLVGMDTEAMRLYMSEMLPNDGEKIEKIRKEFDLNEEER